MGLNTANKSILLQEQDKFNKPNIIIKIWKNEYFTINKRKGIVKIPTESMNILTTIQLFRNVT